MSVIKMRVNKSESVRCYCCGCEREKALDMYDIRFGTKLTITICDACNEELLKKTLRASCMTNSRTKSNIDMRIIKARNRRKQDLT